MRRTLLTPVLFCLLSLPTAAQANQKTAAWRPMHEVEIEFHEAQTNKDLPLMMSLYADNAIFTPWGGKTLTGKTQIEQFWQKSTAFDPKNHFIAYTPSFRLTYTVHGNSGHLYFECIQLDQTTDSLVPNTHVGIDAKMVRIRGHWLIQEATATPLPQL